jgi:hypothetical protein
MSAADLPRRQRAALGALAHQAGLSAYSIEGRVMLARPGATMEATAWKREIDRDPPSMFALVERMLADSNRCEDSADWWSYAQDCGITDPASTEAVEFRAWFTRTMDVAHPFLVAAFGSDLYWLAAWLVFELENA